MSLKMVFDNYINDEKLRFSIKTAKVLPFNSRPNRVSYRNGFSGIVGEIARIIESYSLEDVLIDKKINQLSEEGTIDYENEDKDRFIEIVEEFNPQQLNHTVNSVDLLKCYPLGASKSVLNVSELKASHKEQNSKEEDIAEFIYFIVLQQDRVLFEFLNKNHSKDVLTQLYEKVYRNSGLKTDKNKEYKKFVETYANVIKDDVRTIVSNEKFFVKNFDKFLAYYFFVYCLQIIEKMDISSLNNDESLKLYWLYESEKASSNRKAVINGWKYLRENMGKRMWVNNVVVDIISLIADMDIIGFDKFCNCDYKEDVIEVIRRFNEIIKFNLDFSQITTTREATQLLIKQLSFYYDSETSKQGTQSRYSLWIDELGQKYFLKFRNRYGYALNLTEEFLVLLSALIVTEERIKLNTFFTELEKRGIYLDTKSRKEITKTLDKQGLLEKKSDSGDAQYVRRTMR